MIIQQPIGFNAKGLFQIDLRTLLQVNNVKDVRIVIFLLFLNIFISVDIGHHYDIRCSFYPICRLLVKRYLNTDMKAEDLMNLIAKKKQ